MKRILLLLCLALATLPLTAEKRLVERVYVTKIDITPHSDRYFKNLDASPDWVCVEKGPWQEEAGVAYCFCVYERKR